MSSTILEYLEDTEKKFPEKIAYADLKEGFSFRELKTAAMKIGSKISEVVSPGNPIVVSRDKRA